MSLNKNCFNFVMATPTEAWFNFSPAIYLPLPGI